MQWTTQAYYIFKAPVDVLFKLTNPVVDRWSQVESNAALTEKKLDREAENDGWCQYQAIIQTFLGPVFAVFASAVALDTVAGSLQATTIFVFGRCQS